MSDGRDEIDRILTADMMYVAEKRDRLRLEAKLEQAHALLRECLPLLCFKQPWEIGGEELFRRIEKAIGERDE